MAKKTKQTILDAIKTGTLTATKNDRGHWQIDPMELARVYDFDLQDQSGKPVPTPMETDSPKLEDRIKIAELEAEVKALRGQIERADIERDRERENLSKHIDDMRAAMAVLTDQTKGQGGRRGFLGLFGAKA
ncbi:hypothetical protein [Dinoroseobacter sp. S76]|uniref:hypothetical protein n=1 Tax=Dinoroseobacter sp. S76 TaxID=3415124 RepID=UPI003C7E9EE5